mgnify:CR=1 FL=1
MLFRMEPPSDHLWNRPRLASTGLLLVRSAYALSPKRACRFPTASLRPLPIAIPNFVAGTPGDAEVGVGVSQVITNNLKRSGLFAPIDPAAFIERITNIDKRAAIPELEADQRAGTGDRAHDAAGRRPSEGRIPPLGRQHRPATHRPAILHLAGILAADRAHHLRPDLRAR